MLRPTKHKKDLSTVSKPNLQVNPPPSVYMTNVKNNNVVPPKVVQSQSSETSTSIIIEKNLHPSSPILKPATNYVYYPPPQDYSSLQSQSQQQPSNKNMDFKSSTSSSNKGELYSSSSKLNTHVSMPYTSEAQKPEQTRIGNCTTFPLRVFFLI